MCPHSLAFPFVERTSVATTSVERTRGVLEISFATSIRTPEQNVSSLDYQPVLPEAEEFLHLLYFFSLSA